MRQRRQLMQKRRGTDDVYAFLRRQPGQQFIQARSVVDFLFSGQCMGVWATARIAGPRHIALDVGDPVIAMLRQIFQPILRQCRGLRDQLVLDRKSVV